MFPCAPFPIIWAKHTLIHDQQTQSVAWASVCVCLHTENGNNQPELSQPGQGLHSQTHTQNCNFEPIQTAHKHPDTKFELESFQLGTEQNGQVGRVKGKQKTNKTKSIPGTNTKVGLHPPCERWKMNVFCSWHTNQLS